MEILSNSYFALFLIVALGFILGRIKIFGLSLDVSAIIFVALIFGHYGVVIPKDFQNLGLVLFIFTDTFVMLFLFASVSNSTSLLPNALAADDSSCAFFARFRDDSAYNTIPPARQKLGMLWA